MAELEQRVHGYFDARARAFDTPDFESMLARTLAARDEPQYLPWAFTALAATVLAAVLLLRVDDDRVDALAAARLAMPEAARLVAELSTSTYWTAPSDRWLGEHTRIRYPDMPQFDRMTYRMEELKVWL